MNVLLNEFLCLVLKELATPSTVDEVHAYDYFHLSENFLGTQFTFTPRRPRNPFDGDEGTIEDDFTKRTSWAPSIDKALKALEYPNHLLYIYAANKLSGKVDVEDEFDDCPSDPPNNPYGPNFRMRAYYAAQGKKVPRAAPGSRGGVPTEFQNCVPDAQDTDELWSTKPTTARLIGIRQRHAIVPINQVKFHDDNDTIWTVQTITKNGFELKSGSKKRKLSNALFKNSVEPWYDGKPGVLALFL